MIPPIAATRIDSAIAAATSLAVGEWNKRAARAAPRSAR